MPYWENARIPGKACLAQYIQCPEGFPGNGVTGGAVPFYSFAGDVLQQRLGAHSFFPEYILSLIINQLVTVSVGRNLVTMVGQLANECWKSLGYPSEHEESCFHLVLVKQG